MSKSKVTWLLAQSDSLACVLVLSFVLGCSSGGGGGGGGGTPAAPPQTTTVPLSVSTNGMVQDKNIGANQTEAFHVLSTFPAAGPFVDVALNVPDTFALLTIEAPGSPLQLGGDPIPFPPGSKATVKVKIGQVDHTDTCTNGYLIAQFDIPLDGTVPGQETIPADQHSVNLINTGQYTMCIEVTPTVGAQLTIPSIEFDVTQCDEAPRNMSGEWVGIFSCTSEPSDVGFTCEPDINEEVELFIEQDGHNARYSDGPGEFDGRFSGTVCGGEFHFSGGYVCDDNATCITVESGVFTLTGDNTAGKTSSFDGPCHGDCQDSLSRVTSHRVSGAYDVDFEDTDWTIALQEVSVPGAVTAASEMGASRRTKYTAAAGAEVKVIHRSVERSYNPQTQGAIDHLDVLWKSGEVGAGSSFTERPALFQLQGDGMTIAIFELDDAFSEPVQGEGFTTAEFPFLIASQFNPPGGDDHPNFVNGGRIWFGYVIDGVNVGGGMSEIAHDIDEFSVVVHLED